MISLARRGTSQALRDREIIECKKKGDLPSYLVDVSLSLNSICLKFHFQPGQGRGKEAIPWNYGKGLSIYLFIILAVIVTLGYSERNMVGHLCMMHRHGNASASVRGSE